MRKTLVAGVALGFLAVMYLSSCGDTEVKGSNDHRTNNGCRTNCNPPPCTTCQQQPVVVQQVPVQQYVVPQTSIAIFPPPVAFVPQIARVDVAVRLGELWFVDMLVGNFVNRIAINIGQRYYSEPCGCYYGSDDLDRGNR